jgi:hypothetical protein
LPLFLYHLSVMRHSAPLLATIAATAKFNTDQYNLL